MIYSSPQADRIWLWVDYKKIPTYASPARDASVYVSFALSPRPEMFWLEDRIQRVMFFSFLAQGIEIRVEGFRVKLLKRLVLEPLKCECALNPQTPRKANLNVLKLAPGTLHSQVATMFAEPVLAAVQGPLKWYPDFPQMVCIQKPHIQDIRR